MTASEAVARAEDCVGIPVRPHGRTEHGLDCAGLLYRVFEPLGIEDFHGYDDRPSSAFVYRQIGRYADRIDGEGVRPGDVALFNFGGKSTHFGVVTDPETAVCPDVRRGEVARTRFRGAARVVAYFRMRGVI